MTKPDVRSTEPVAAAAAPSCDLSVTCFVCGTDMKPEHAHYRCPACGWRDSCCDGPY